MLYADHNITYGCAYEEDIIWNYYTVKRANYENWNQYQDLEMIESVGS